MTAIVVGATYVWKRWKKQSVDVDVEMGQKPKKDTFVLDPVVVRPRSTVIGGFKNGYGQVPDIDLTDASEIFKQTGFEFHFADGEEVKLDFWVGKGNFSIAYFAQKLTGEFAVEKRITEKDAIKASLREATVQRRCAQAGKGVAEIWNTVNLGTSLHHFFKVAGFGSARNLLDLVKCSSDTKLNTDIVTWLGLSILRGLETIGREGVIHRDIKPENILVYADGEICITDFGCIEINDDKDNLMLPWHSDGDKRFRSPDQLEACRLKGNAKFNGPKGDVFAAGLVLLLAHFNEDDPRILLGMPMSFRECVRVCDKPFFGSKFAPIFQSQPPNSLMGSVRQLVEVNPEARLTAEQARRLPYFSRHEGMLEDKEARMKDLAKLKAIKKTVASISAREARGINNAEQAEYYNNNSTTVAGGQADLSEQLPYNNEGEQADYN